MNTIRSSGQLPVPASDHHTNLNLRIQVSLSFQEAVNAGSADWRINEVGETEFHLKTGEIFLLQETTVLRLK
ncbi:hypothetical protein D3C76_899730 [compost metagenome]|jgi:hypothetical protein